MSAAGMRAEDAVATIAATRTGAVAVLTMSGLGLWDDLRPEDFRLVGLMGAAASIGLGLAVGRPDRDVWVVDGDGSLLMQLGVLSAVGAAAPERLVHVVLANEVYAISGAQPTPGDVDWVALALGAGYRGAVRCATQQELAEALTSGEPGPRMVVADCLPVRPTYPAGVFAVDPRLEAPRVRAALAAQPEERGEAA